MWIALFFSCLGTDGPQFAPPVRYPSAAVRALIARDLDGDGVPEIVVSGDHVDERDAFSLFVNRGDGTFESERLLPSAFGERIEDISDIDGDGVPDLLASNFGSNGIATYRGKGSFQFDGGTFYGTATHGGPSLVADYDGDGIPDVVSFSFGSGNPVRLHLFRGRVDGTLAPKETIETSLANANLPSMRTIGGALEIVVSERSGNLGLLHFNKTVAVSRIPAGAGFDIDSLFVDVNGDGVADIVHTTDDNGTAEAIFVMLGKPDGTFDAPKRLGSPRRVAFPVAVRAGDLDGDGHADLIVRDLGASSVYYFRGDGAGNFEPAAAIDAGGVVDDIAIADVNHDGRPDIITANDDHFIAVSINEGPCHPPRRRAARH